MDINLDQKQLEESISKAIIESAIGKNIINAINDNLRGYTGEKVIKDAIEGRITLIANQLINEEFKDIIKDKIREQLSDKLFDKLVTGYIDKFHDIDWDKLFS